MSDPLAAADSPSSRPRPRIEVLDPLAPRLVPETLPVVPASATPPRAPLVLAGAAVLLGGLTVLEIGNFVAAQFARDGVLGWLTLAVTALGLGLIGAGLLREARAFLGLAAVDRLRARLAGSADVAPAAREWLGSLPSRFVDPALGPAIAAAGDPAAIRALLRAGPGTRLREAADQAGRRAALELFATTAAIPSPALDGALAIWRGLRLVREIAGLHGLRPGLAGTLILARRITLGGIGVAAANIATEAAARAFLSNPLLDHVAGDLAGAGVAARRMIVLARLTDAACSPLG